MPPDRPNAVAVRAASVATTGIWFELILQQMILRDVYDKPPKSAEFQWALTEMAGSSRWCGR